MYNPIKHLKDINFEDLNASEFLSVMDAYCNQNKKPILRLSGNEAESKKDLETIFAMHFETVQNLRQFFDYWNK